jgi:hypothetical protein
MTSLRDELSREIPPLAAPRLGLLRSRLAAESERLGQLYGSIAAERPLVLMTMKKLKSHFSKASRV